MTNQLQGTSLAIYNELKKRSIPVAGYKSGGGVVYRVSLRRPHAIYNGQLTRYV